MSASRIDSTGVGGALRLSPPPYEFYSFGLVVLQTRAERKTVLAGPSGSFQQDCDVGLFCKRSVSHHFVLCRGTSTHSSRVH